MNIRTLALILAAGLTVAAGGVSATACSSSSSGSTPEKDSGSGGDGTASSSGGTEEEGGSSSGGEAGVDCGSTPSLHVDEAGTVYCGFGADGGSLDCFVGTQCCLGGGIGGGQFAPQECLTYGQTCTNGGADAGTNEQPLPVQCAQNADCVANGSTAGSVACCLQGNAKCASNYTCGSTTGACDFAKYSDGTGVMCENTAACAAGEIQVCSQQSDCPTGKTCTPGKWKLLQLGFCL